MKKDLLNALRTMLILSIKTGKNISMEKVYYPEIDIVNNISYLYGALVICDEERKETFFIRDTLFGYDTSESRSEAKDKGFVFIRDSLLLTDIMDVVNYRYTKIKKK